MRGIGVALSTSTSTASPLLVSASRSRTPKRCCSSTTASASALKITSSWISAWVPTRKSISPASSRARISRRSLPFSRPVRIATRRPARSASGAMVLMCWRARISVGAISAACLPASVDRGRGEQRHHRLAGPDVALQQPQHPHRLAQILGDGGDRLALRGCQRVGQRVDDPVAQMAVAGVAVAGRTPQLRAHQRQRQLAGQQFVEGEPRPERAIGQDVGEFDRHMHAVQRFARSAESCSGE